MRGFICVILLGLTCASQEKTSHPKVQVYSHKREEFGKPNTLICHVSDFFPPLITVKLLKDGEPMGGGKETDLAFEETWNYHLTKYATFTPEKGAQYSCDVTHMGTMKKHIWEADV